MPILSDLETLFGEALQSVQQGQSQQAQTLFYSITEKWPDCKEAWYHLGELHQQANQPEQALEMYQRVLELDPSIQEVYLNLGLLAAQCQQPELALNYWQQALTINPLYHQVRLYRVLLAINLGQQEGALRDLQMMLLQDASSAAFLWEQAQELQLAGQCLECSVICQALRQFSQFEFTNVTLLEIQALYELGLNTLAQDLIVQLEEPFADILKALYVPAFYLTQTDLEQSKQLLRDRLSQATAITLEPRQVQFLPRFSAWELLGERALVDAYLAHLGGLPQPNLQVPVGSRQRLVLMLDTADLPWQTLFWQALAALPAKNWELYLCLNKASDLDSIQLSRPNLFAGVFRLDPNLPASLEQLRQLQAHVILFSAPTRNKFQFWLSHLRLAPVQWAWPINGQSLRFDDKSCLDSLAPHWFQPALQVAQTRGESFVFPIPAQGWQAHDLQTLTRLSHYGPILLIATAPDIRKLEALKSALDPNVSSAAEIMIWNSFADLELVYSRARVLLSSEYGAELYIQAASSCGLPWLHSHRLPDNAQELDALIQSLQEASTSDAHFAWQERDVLNPTTQWAVSLQDQLNRALRMLL